MGTPRYSASEYPDEYKVLKLLGHRKAARGGSFEFLVRWAGKDTSQDPPVPWADSYEPESGVADDLIEAYFTRVAAIESQFVRVDVKPLFHLARRTLANAVCMDKSRAEPIEHNVAVDALALEPLARAFLDMAAARFGSAGKPLPVETNYDDDGTKNLQLVLDTMPRIADFCAFEHFVDGTKAFGCIRHDLGRVTNKEISVLAPPLVFTASFNRKVEGVVSFSMRFPTVRINGATGAPTLPQLPPSSSHPLKRESNLDRVVQYVKQNLPSTHPLVGKGWCELPAMQWELNADVAVPSE